MTTDASGNVYVADSQNNRIQKFSSDGTYLSQWGSPGSGNGQFNFPIGVATDMSGNVYVADTRNSRIEKFKSDGTYLSQWGPALGNGLSISPLDVTTDTSGNVYVAEAANRIDKFTSDGTYLSQWGSSGSGNGQFNYPLEVAMDASDNVVVADTQNNRIQGFASNGTYLFQYGSSGTGNGQFSNPSAIAVRWVTVCVVDNYNSRVEVFSSSRPQMAKIGEGGYMAAGTVIVPVATTTGPVTSGHRYPALNEHTVQVADDIPPYNGSVNADSPLYGVKIALENIDEGLTFNQSERLEKESQHEELRLAEAKEELAENKGDAADNALDLYLQKLNQTETDMSSPDIDPATLLNTQETNTRHQIVLENLLSKHSGDQGLTRAYNKNLDLGLKFENRTGNRFNRSQKQ